MGLQIVTKKRFINSLQRTTVYLKKEWNQKVVEDFKQLVFIKIELLSFQPNIGSDTLIKNIKSVIVGKGYQNRMYYKVEKNKLVIIDLKDTRKDPKQNRYSK